MRVSKTPAVGERAPDFTGVDTEGREVRLSQYWQEGNVALVLLRHLGCTFCRQHVNQLRAGYPEFRAVGAEVVCVAMGSAKVGKGFKILFDLPFPVVTTGESTEVYRRYGLGKGAILDLLGPKVWREGIKAILGLGRKFFSPLMADPFQMPGTFVIDRTGTIRLAHRNKDASDNPPNTLLLDALRELNEQSECQKGTSIEPHPSKPPATAGAR